MTAVSANHKNRNQNENENSNNSANQENRNITFENKIGGQVVKSSNLIAHIVATFSLSWCLCPATTSLFGVTAEL